ncbi:STAS domain-containing protein [Chondromyces apiculatus]|uniref:RsbR, positive regulator of sigma-B n=1 Tax=Chondromyces apiculatus DSM 436 TaxID=1192034 RepID=A0A017SU76_9BACT|nr:STAS domain-containing protein [Chondromyces apiculatus]EYF00504.1 RsbR, positive regulator of sigma-B [Chondromyces apiculatus DSM 436]
MEDVQTQTPAPGGADESLEAMRHRVVELEKALADRDRTISALRQELAGLREVEREQKLLVSILDNCTDFVGFGREDGSVHYVNRAGQQMMGIGSDEEARRTLIPQYFAPEDLPFVTSHVLPEVKKNGRWQGSLRFRNMKTGELFPVHYNIFTVLDDTGALAGLGTVTQNMTERRQVEAEQARLTEELIRAQAAALEQLSTPLIPITEDVVVMPLIGTVDSRRAQQVMENLMRGVVDLRCHTVILDITGVSMVDSGVANALIRAAQGVRLLGARTVLTGISPHIAQTLVTLGIDFDSIITHGTLQSGIAWATAERPGSEGSRSRRSHSG